MPRARAITLSAYKFNPLQRIIVSSSKQRPYSTNSIGYIAYIQMEPNRFRQLMHMIFIRFGKTGKPRCTYERLYHPLLNIGELNSEDRKNLIEEWRGMGLVGRDQSNDTIFSPDVFKSRSLLEFSDIEFVGYIATFGSYIYLLSNDVGEENLGRNRGWPYNLVVSSYHSKRAIQNLDKLIDDHPGNINISNIAPTLLGISRITKVKEVDHFERMLNLFRDLDKRTEYMEKLNRALCNIKNLVVNYHYNADLSRSLSMTEAVNIIKVLRKVKAGQ